MVLKSKNIANIVINTDYNIEYNPDFHINEFYHRQNGFKYYFRDILYKLNINRNILLNFIKNHGKLEKDFILIKKDGGIFLDNILIHKNFYYIILNYFREYIYNCWK